jgi:hypothetical protein
LFVLLFIYWSRIYSQVLIPNIPSVTGGYVSAFEFDSLTNKLYLAGDFTQVGSKPRQGFAVIDITTGTVLNDFDLLTIGKSFINSSLPVKIRMKIHKNKLYIGGVLGASYNSGALQTNYLFTLGLYDGSVNSLYANSAISDFKIYNDKIYIAGGYENYTPDEYLVSELDTLGNILWQNSISTNPSDKLFCLDIKNNNLYAGGIFSSFGGISHHNIVKINLSTHAATTWSLSPQPGISPNLTCYGVSNIICYPNDILIDLFNSSCGSPHNIGFYNASTGALNNQATTVPYLGDYPNVFRENDTSFWYCNSSGLKYYGLHHYVSSWSPNSGGQNLTSFFRKSDYLFVGGSFTSLESTPHTGLGVYCLPPEKPVLQTASPSVCRLQKNVAYSIVPDPKAVSYTWNYTGTGVTISGSGTSVNLDFSSNAFSGTLEVIAYSKCGAPSSTLSIPISVHPLPTMSAGPDIHFTCIRTNGVLNGTPSNSFVHSTWTGPSSYYSTSAYNQVQSSNVTGGNYIFTVIINATGCQKSDTLTIFFDTLKPVINHLSGNFVLTCKTNSVILDASANYPSNDTLHWSGVSFSQSNPAVVTNTGNYILTVTSGANGCKNKDSVVVTQNFTPPNLSLSLNHDTITCIKDSILLHSSSSDINAILYWKDPGNDSLFNNSFIDQPGIYTAHALDTSNGCTSQSAFFISKFTTPPTVNINPGNYQLTCSYNSAVLNGSSLNTGALLTWTGPGNFSSVNPASATIPGIYVLTATHPKNGCTAKDSVNVILKNILQLNISADTTICNGTSAMINASPIGGTAGFTYSWNNNTGNSPSASVFPADTTKYIITVTDSTGCIGIDSVTINVPVMLSDSLVAFIPCDPNHPTGQVQVFGSGGVLPYVYSINSGSFQSSGVFSSLGFGTYTVAVKDGLGCLFNSIAIIDSSSLLPSPDFILSTNEIRGDTFVIVDISNPRPDSVSWILPSNCQLANTNLFAPEIINSDTGVIQITMLAWFGTCQMSITKNVHIFKSDTSIANNYNINGIKSLTLYPNPNTGYFTVDLSFYKVQPCAIFIFDALGNELLRIPYSNSDFISAPIGLPNPGPGTYVLKVISAYDSKTKTFQVTN